MWAPKRSWFRSIFETIRQVVWGQPTIQTSNISSYMSRESHPICPLMVVPPISNTNCELFDKSSLLYMSFTTGNYKYEEGVVKKLPWVFYRVPRETIITISETGGKNDKMQLGVIYWIASTSKNLKSTCNIPTAYASQKLFLRYLEGVNFNQNYVKNYISDYNNFYIYTPELLGSNFDVFDFLYIFVYGPKYQDFLMLIYVLRVQEHIGGWIKEDLYQYLCEMNIYLVAITIDEAYMLMNKSLEISDKIYNDFSLFYWKNNIAEVSCGMYVFWVRYVWYYDQYFFNK